MSTRSVGMGEMFGWIPASFSLATRNIGTMAIASLLTIAAWFLLALPMILVLFSSMKGLGSPGVPQPPDLTAVFIGYGIMIVLGIALFPPIVAGWFRLCEAADRGEPVGPLRIFAPYRDSGTWVRLVVFALLALITYVVIGGLIALLFRGAFTDIVALQMAQMTGVQPELSPAALGRIFLMYAVMMPTFALLQVVYMAGMAEVSLRPTSPLNALKDAFAAVGRNFLKLLVFLFALFIILVIAMVIVSLVMMVVMMVTMMVHPMLGFVAMGLLYLLMICLIYPVMFASGFYSWRSLITA